MQRTSFAALFTRADSTALPALGGMARPDGVVIASERFFAFARETLHARPATFAEFRQSYIGAQTADLEPRTLDARPRI